MIMHGRLKEISSHLQNILL